MNIEEISITGALGRFMGKYGNIHLSDNNRLFPGLGGMDFKSILTFLHMADYTGKHSIEGKIRRDLVEDLRISLRFLSGLLPGSDV
jgi:sugar phosphate isomerase/epimerase